MTPDIVSESVDMCFDLSAAHRNEVFLKIENLHRNKTFCDVKLIIGEKIIWVHKLLLVASLPYFHSMFTHDLIEKQQESIILKDMDPLAVELVIEFVYTSKININQNNVQTLLRVSTILQVSLVQEKCCEFLEKQLDPSNCLGIYTFAELHGCIELKMKAKNYCDRHFSKVVKEEEFLSLPFERVRWFLDQNELCVRTEKEVYRAAMDWIEQNEGERMSYLPSLLSLVRLHLLPKAFLTMQIESNNAIAKNNFSMELMKDVLKDIEKKVIPVERRVPQGNTVIFCMGGYNKKSFASYEYFNPDTEEWKRLGVIPKPKSGAGALFVGGLLYLVGGRTSSLLDVAAYDSDVVDVYDPFNQEWFTAAKLSVPRHRLGICAIDGTIYAVGGSDGIIHLDSMEKYDAENDRWTPTSSMFIRRMGVGVAVLDGLLYAVGGFDSENRLRSVECYAPESNAWKFVASMNTPRSGAGVTALNGHVYAVGGYNGVTQLSSVERYCPFEDRWTLITPMNEHRSALSVAVTHNKLFALGGYNGERFLDSVEVYDPESGEWRIIQPMLDSRSGAGVAVGTIPIT